MIFFRTAVILFLVSVSVHSDSLKLNLGLWDGKYSTEFQERWKKDNLIDGAPDGITRFDRNWNGRNMSIYPLGVSHFKDFSSWTLVTRFNLIHRSLDAKFNSFDTYGNITFNSVNRSYSADYELDFGYKKTFFSERLSLTGRLGIRSHVKHLLFNETTLGTSTLFGTVRSEMSSYSNHFYPGAEIQYFFGKGFSVIADVLLPVSQPDLGKVSGNMKFDSDRAGSYTGRTYIELNDMESKYTYRLSRASLGISYDVNEKLTIGAGFRAEKTDVSYNGLKSNPIRIASGGTGTNFSAYPSPTILFNEKFLDTSLYKQNLSSDQKGVFISASYKFDLSK